jgi:Fibronectin type 3 domain-containing protein
MKKRAFYRFVTYILPCLLFLFLSKDLFAQTTDPQNLSAKAFVTDEGTIKLRWAPANPRSWIEGKQYGYRIERYTLMIDNSLQDYPYKQEVESDFKPKPLDEWMDLIEKSDYAAVIAQAFYGEDFELTTSNNDLGSIINQANELEQRFSTSLFVADLDYEAAKMAGWAWTDNDAKNNEKYLYRIFLNRPEPMEGDTSAVFIGLEDRMELPEPIGLTALFGDRSVLLSWNYLFQSNIYPAYHIEKKSSIDTTFRRITEIPVTILVEDMNEIFYTDSLANNEDDYTYRVVGVTCFGQEGPSSEEVTGRGKKMVICVPRISGGEFISDDDAHLFWEFDCEDVDFIQRFQIARSDTPDGIFHILVDSVPVYERKQTVRLVENRNYLKIQSIHKDSTIKESYPFLLQKIDSIPPEVPTGLNVFVDSTGVAHLSWEMNQELDLRGYRILRSFTPDGEKTAISSGFIPDNVYRDSLSFSLGNTHVYYALTALDIRYNESLPSKTVVVDKPTLATPDEPVIQGYQVSDNLVEINWLTDKKREDVYYSLLRYSMEDIHQCDTVYTGDNKTISFVDKPAMSGKYQYVVVATDLQGKKSVSPQRITVEISSSEDVNSVSRFSYYADRDRNYIELSWRRQAKARLYRIYRSEDDAPMELWKETDELTTSIVDELVFPGTLYTYTILYLTTENKMSKPRTVSINY